MLPAQNELSVNINFSLLFILIGIGDKSSKFPLIAFT